MARNPKLKDLYESIKKESNTMSEFAKRITKSETPKPPSLPLEGSTIMRHRLMRDSVDSDKGNNTSDVKKE